MSKQIIGIFALNLILITSAADSLDTARAEIPTASLVGEGRLKVLFWKVFDAQLYAPRGEWSMQAPFALSLNYLRHLDGEKIAERSIDEIRDQGFNNEAKLNEWLRQMRAIFPDVDQTTTLTGVYKPQQETRFYLNGELIGRVDDPAFGERFFKIWLGEKSSQPKLRNKLIGGARS
ncbi:MAG: chalcone isomerase family protein [Pseudomonadota bacterium]